MAAATEAAAVTATAATATAGIGRAHHQAQAREPLRVIIRFIMTLLFSQIARRRGARTSRSRANETSDD
jgi:hypothetical protein